MHLTLLPQRGLPGQPEMTISIAGDTILLDGVTYDLSLVPEGGEGWTEDESPFIPPIRRLGGVLHVQIVARLGDTAQPQQDGPWVVPEATGDVPIPAARTPTTEVAE